MITLMMRGMSGKRNISRRPLGYLRFEMVGSGDGFGKKRTESRHGQNLDRIQNPVLEVYLTDGSNETVEEKREQRMILSNQMDGEHIALS